MCIYIFYMYNMYICRHACIASYICISFSLSLTLSLSLSLSLSLLYIHIYTERERARDVMRLYREREREMPTRHGPSPCHGLGSVRWAHVPSCAGAAADGIPQRISAVEPKLGPCQCHRQSIGFQQAINRQHVIGNTVAYT